MKDKYLTDGEKKAIQVLNFIARYDGIIQSEEDIKYLLNEGIKKFISKKNRSLVDINQDEYPISIKFN